MHSITVGVLSLTVVEADGAVVKPNHIRSASYLVAAVNASAEYCVTVITTIVLCFSFAACKLRRKNVVHAYSNFR